MAVDIVGQDRLVTLATEIVTAYVTRNQVQAAELPGLLRSVHSGLLRLSSGSGEPTEEPRTLTATEIRRSIRPEGLISFEDGKAYKTLRRHLTKRGLTPEAYRAKWGLPVDYPMTASAYSAQRSQLALDRGLGRPRSLASETSDDQSGGVPLSDTERAAELPEQADAPDEIDESITRVPFEDDGAAH
ncbi:MucR family transcriptional regulator [Methylorubrum extorquens]|uniref:MucR family transcriptional regulator n=1 Tax=Methylorubrum extorquens TaxID=408 RepID=A0AAX3WF34_METEX|nr:MucR family transcriptional regulator [Methylorubrum extorquens]ABY28596.1 ROSMUCR transcriptional regulator [Methylorubrum extorquens PA1]KQP85691.1 MucR family transcriptional regulator [Methylobacterium sp. Leaf119]WHQ70212.1 MucR family transcriptional regulator [Methylorubrum extorquens]